ncbi:DPP IV N-terminal domain-containing protein [Paenarthrobacter sp. NPDC056912]|uniref:S9 family peptidase n=1 Tax=Paenarthrobacter sp. NPDC056912 TaxID=3345965 RepID=UPI00366D7D1F
MLKNSLPVQAYDRAERLLGHHRPELVLRSKVSPEWIGDTGRFTYRVDTERGGEFVLIDPATATKSQAFDHERLATVLSAAADQMVKPYALPFRSVEVTDDAIEFGAFDSRWRYQPADGSCTRKTGPAQSDESGVASPDGKWVAFRRDHNVWVRSVDTDEETAITTDGSADLSYACDADSIGSRFRLAKLGLRERPRLMWSPDSSRILTHQIDQRPVEWMHLVESVPADGSRPRLHSYRYALPGEPLPQAEWVVLDVAARSVVRGAGTFNLEYASPLLTAVAWWAADGATVYHLDTARDQLTLRLVALDPATGELRTLITESDSTRVEPAQVGPPLVKVLAGGQEALWYSQRDGWGHLYRYDLATGEPVEQLTKGELAVQQILHVDETERVAYLTVSGLVPNDPYCRTLVKVSLDGGELTRLTDDHLDHEVSTDPAGQWFVDSASTVNTPPTITLRDRNGTVVMELERADITRLLAAGWTAPERIRALAADGVTEIFGVLHKPYGFDPTKSYPVIDHPYPGPQIHRVRPGFDQGGYASESEAMVALGFAVFAIDGRGTPGRDKAFHDYSWRNMGGAGGLEDHVAALKQLGTERPWLDLDRVGIFGLSGGGFATARALLTFPDFYRVGVAEAGNHDNRFYIAGWAEIYDGPYDPEAGARLSNTELAANLTGKLMLVHGDMDDNVTPHLTMRLVDALIEANRDFDLLIVPGVEHSFYGRRQYVTRRRWDYFVRHLMNVEPPTNYRIPEAALSAEELAAAAS